MGGVKIAKARMYCEESTMAILSSAAKMFMNMVYCHPPHIPLIQNFKLCFTLILLFHNSLLMDHNSSFPFEESIKGGNLSNKTKKIISCTELSILPFTGR